MTQKEWINVDKALIQPVKLDRLPQQQIRLDVLRLDRIHPVVSGNKWFKLKYHLLEAHEKNCRTVLTFGGAWSNHIIATAFAAREEGLAAIGIIRGERPPTISRTLENALQMGMQLEFVSRTSYSAKQRSPEIKDILQKYGSAYIIPEGGAGLPGISGSKEILQLADTTSYSHIMCCIGTGTMFLGLLNSMLPGQRLIGIPVLKGFSNSPAQFEYLTQDVIQSKSFTILEDYHFGGYAKKTAPLLDFMNQFYKLTGIPTDFVYTGKLFYALNNLLENNYFPRNSRILVIHSGGLQGNESLHEGILAF